MLAITSGLCVANSLWRNSMRRERGDRASCFCSGKVTMTTPATSEKYRASNGNFYRIEGEGHNRWSVELPRKSEVRRLRDTNAVVGRANHQLPFCNEEQSASLNKRRSRLHDLCADKSRIAVGEEKPHHCWQGFQDHIALAPVGIVPASTTYQATMLFPLEEARE